MFIVKIFFCFASLFLFLYSAASAENLPSIPNGEIQTSDAMRIREQLELIKKDVEQKIIKLQEAKISYDKSKLDMDTELKNIQEERRVLEETLQKEKQIKEDRVKSAVDFLVKMEPKKVAFLMESMDRDLVIILLSKLPQRQVTKIFENMTPAKGTQYLEYYTHVRSGREFDMLKDLGLCSSANISEEKNAKP